MDINTITDKILRINKDNGWDMTQPQDWGHKYKIPSKLALITSETSEALEAFRIEDFKNFKEELADQIIRILDLAGGMEIDMETEIYNKLEKNRTRGHRHGGKKV